MFLGSFRKTIENVSENDLVNIIRYLILHLSMRYKKGTLKMDIPLS